MADPKGQITRFLVQHERCGGAQVEDLTEADLTATATGAWVTARCPGCGNAIRVELNFATEFREAAECAGVTVEEFYTLLSEGEAGRMQLEQRLEKSPRVGREVLLSVLRARRELEERSDD